MQAQQYWEEMWGVLHPLTQLIRPSVGLSYIWSRVAFSSDQKSAKEGLQV